MSAPESVRDGDTVLRRWIPQDGLVIARLVARNLDHLARWLPWANATSTEETFQRDRFASLVSAYDDDAGTWEYAICDATARDAPIGSCGIAVRDDGRREIGYWVDAAHCKRGHATRAARLLTQAWRERRAEPRIEIRCNEANTASAAIPRKLGYRLVGVIDEPPVTPSESGRTMVWVCDRADVDGGSRKS